MASNNTDRITGLSFDTHYAALLHVGGRYAQTFDGKVREVATVSDIRPDGKVRITFTDTPTGKALYVPAEMRFFIR